jgi:hypothetical protein
LHFSIFINLIFTVERLKIYPNVVNNPKKTMTSAQEVSGSNCCHFLYFVHEIQQISTHVLVRKSTHSNSYAHFNIEPLEYLQYMPIPLSRNLGLVQLINTSTDTIHSKSNTITQCCLTKKRDENHVTRSFLAFSKI